MNAITERIYDGLFTANSRDYSLDCAEVNCEPYFEFLPGG